MPTQLTDTSVTTTDSRTGWRAWFGLVCAPAAWLGQLILGYAIVAHSCFPTDHPLAVPHFSDAQPVVIGVSVIASLVALAALVLALRTRRAGAPDREQQSDAFPSARERLRFMGAAGTIVSGLFLFGTIMTTIPLLTTRLCHG